MQMPSIAIGRADIDRTSSSTSLELRPRSGLDLGLEVEVGAPSADLEKLAPCAALALGTAVYVVDQDVVSDLRVVRLGEGRAGSGVPGRGRVAFPADGGDAFGRRHVDGAEPESGLGSRADRGRLRQLGMRGVLRGTSRGARRRRPVHPPGRAREFGPGPETVRQRGLHRRASREDEARSLGRSRVGRPRLREATVGRVFPKDRGADATAARGARGVPRIDRRQARWRAAGRVPASKDSVGLPNARVR